MLSQFGVGGEANVQVFKYALVAGRQGEGVVGSLHLGQRDSFDVLTVVLEHGQRLVRAEADAPERDRLVAERLAERVDVRSHFAGVVAGDIDVLDVPKAEAGLGVSHPGDDLRLEIERAVEREGLWRAGAVQVGS